MRRLTIIALACAFVAPAAADAQTRGTGPRASLAAGAVTFQARTTGPVTVTCRSNEAAVSGGARNLGGATLLGSTPQTTNSWQIRVLNSGNGPTTVSATARCVSLRVPFRARGATISITTRTSAEVILPAGGAGQTEMRCPRGEVPVGYGFDSTRGLVDTYRAARGPGGRTLRVGMRNLARTESRGRGVVRCLQTRSSAARGNTRYELRWKFRTVRRTLNPAAGTSGAGLTCPRGHASLAEGYDFAPLQPLALLSARPERTRSGRYSFLAGAPATVNAAVVCLDTRTPFVQRPRPRARVPEEG